MRSLPVPDRAEYELRAARTNVPSSAHISAGSGGHGRRSSMTVGLLILPAVPLARPMQPGYLLGYCVERRLTATCRAAGPRLPDFRGAGPGGARVGAGPGWQPVPR